MACVIVGLVCIVVMLLVGIAVCVEEGGDE